MSETTWNMENNIEETEETTVREDEVQEVADVQPAKQKTKTVSFRLKEDTAEKIKDFIESMGGSKEDALASLMSVYELHNSKSLIPDREKDIENFEFYVHKMVSAYVASLETCELAEEKIKANYEQELTSKKKIITDLQEKDEQNKAKIAEQKKELDEAKEKQKLAEKEVSDTKKSLETTEQLAKAAEVYLTELKEAQEKLAGYDDLKASEAELSKQVGKLEQKILADQKDAEIALERAVMENQKKADKTLAELEREKDARILELEKAVALVEEKNTRIARLEKSEEKLESKLEKLNDKLDTIQAERNQLKDENYDLKAQIRELQAQLTQIQKK